MHRVQVERDVALLLHLHPAEEDAIPVGPDLGKFAQARRDVGVAAEELVGVVDVDVVGFQPPVGAHRARLGQRAGRDQRRILVQDRAFQRRDVRARVQGEFVVEDPAQPTDRLQCVALPAGLVLRGGQQDPAAFP
jgi:hypothetical protein